MTRRVIIHADLNSFFAMAEQQANPKLRGKPVGVVKGEGRACIIAASVEAKKFGVGTGSNAYEAKKLCPDIILIPADFDKYEYISRQFIDICRSYSPVCEAFSLDECFIDVTESERIFPRLPRKLSLEEIAWIEMGESLRGSADGGNVFLIGYEIKRRLKEDVGDYLTCSVGVSHNKLLAKLASEQIKPDGFTWITNDNKIQILDKSELMDVCGLGYGLYNHLITLGINSFPKLRAQTMEFLQTHFGPYWSVHLYNICRGLDETPVVPIEQIPNAKSVGRTYTTHRNLKTRDEIEALIRNLCEEAAFKARRMGLAGRYVGLALRSGSESYVSYQSTLPSHPEPACPEFDRRVSGSTFPSHPELVSGSHKGIPNLVRNDTKEEQRFYGHRTLKTYIDDGAEFFRYCLEISKNWNISNVRFCGVNLGMLAPKAATPLPLFAEEARREKLTNACDLINDKYGDYTIFPAKLGRMPLIMPEVTGYFGDRSFRLKDLRKN